MVKKAVDFLMAVMIARPALALPQRDNYNYLVRTDASGFAIGATLHQLQLPDATEDTAELVERIIAYLQKLYNAKTRHSTYSKELLSI